MATATRRPERARRKSISEIAGQVSATIGAEFFESLAKNLGESLSADCLYIGEFVGGQVERVRTVTAYMDDASGCSSDYTLAGSVAAQVVTGDSWSCTRGVVKRFPSDALLLEVRAQACIAAPLLDPKGRALGVIMAAFRRPLTNTRLPKSILETFAPRASAEVRRKQAEAALRESEQRYHAFISQNADAMWRIEFERSIPTELPEDEQVEGIYRYGYLAECNDAMARLLGYDKADQLIGTGFEQLARNADPNLREDLRSAIRSGYRFDTVETRPLDKEGHARHLLRSQWCIVENGKLERIWGTLRDITELKRIEEALQTSERRLAELLESVHLLTVMLNVDGSITYCNDYVLRLTGWQAREVNGKNWFDLMVPSEEREKVRMEFASNRLNSEGPFHLESTLLGKDGGRRLIAWESSILRDSEGKATGLAGVGRDITILRAIQGDRSQSRKIESIRRSVCGMVQEFADVLTIISGYCALLLQDRQQTDPAFTPLQEIQKAAAQGTSLTRQLLAFSGQPSSHAELLDLNPLIREVGRTIQHRLPGNVQLHIELDPSLGVVRADAAQFREVLLNLVTNAMEAMPEGGHLTMHSTNIELDEARASQLRGIAPGHYVLLAVADTGKGMSEEVRAHLFEPFFTTKNARAGLGLAAAYGIVQQSNGHIVVDTAPDMGTMFQIYLPMV
jgi:PAS domain S-box-containing protein